MTTAGRTARGGGWIRAIRIEDDEPLPDGHPFDLPAVASLAAHGELPLHPGVTFVVGENGSCKSTLVEAVAVAAGFNAEGGSRNFRFGTRDSTSALHERLTLIRSPSRPSTGYFLRAESFYNVATEVDQLAAGPGGGHILAAHGGRSLHERSHGESFLTLLTHRFGPDGLYILDEPEAAMSPQGCLAMLRAVHELVAAGGQFVIATHSPLLMAYPDATVYELCADGAIERTSYDELDHVTLYRSFLDAPERFLRPLLDE